MTDEWMAEFERLLAEYAYAVGPYGHDLIRNSTRAALMAHVETMRTATREALLHALPFMKNHGMRMENDYSSGVSDATRAKGAALVRSAEIYAALVDTTITTITAAPQPVGEEPCDVPPVGWRCTRANGHEGPCAALEVKP